MLEVKTFHVCFNENMFFHHVPMLCFNLTLGINLLFCFLVGRAWQCTIMWMENNNWTKNLGENGEPQQPHLDENGSREDFVEINYFKICISINWCKSTKLQQMKWPEFLRVASDAPLKMNMSRRVEMKVDLFIGLSPFIAIPPPFPSPVWGLTFSSYPWGLNEIAFTPEDLHKI